MENDSTTMAMWTTEKDMTEMTAMTANITTPLVSTTALPLPPFLDHGLSIVLVFAFIFGIAGNGAAIMIFVKTKSLRTPPNMLIVNLAISDFGMVITNFPLMFASTIYNRWLFGDAGCQFYAFCGALFGIMSIANMTAIALDRYYVICWSLEAVRSVTHRRSMIIIIIVWCYAIFWSIPPFFGVGSYVLEGYGLGCTFDFMTKDLNHYLHVSFLFASSFVVPVTIIIVCFTRIAMTVRAHRHELNKMRTKLTEDKDKKHKSSIRRANKAKTEFQIAKVGFQVTIFYVLSWMPYSIVAVIGQYFDSDLLTPLGTVVPVIFAKCSAIWNPIIYCLSHEKFNAALKEKLMGMCGIEIPSKHRSMGSQESSVTGRRGMHRQNSSTLSESSVTSTVEQDAIELKGRKQGPATVKVQQEKGEGGTYRRNPGDVTFSKDAGVEIDEKERRGDQGQCDDRARPQGEGQMDQWSQPPPAPASAPTPGVNDKEYLTKM